ncbi:hypothetical protein ACHAW6_007834 [Cyclotella cf. meneghiniana]
MHHVLYHLTISHQQAQLDYYVDQGFILSTISMNYQTYKSWVLAITLAHTFHQSVDASYYCGASYNDAIASCNITCPSALNYNAQTEQNECPENKPYCFGPDLPCTPLNEDNANNVLNLGLLSLGKLSNMLAVGENETDSTSAPSGAYTGNDTLTPSLTPAPSSALTTDITNVTFAPSPTPEGSIQTNATVATFVAAANKTNATVVSSPFNESLNATTSPNTVNITYPPSMTPTATVDELVYRKTLDNPQNMFCGSGWQNATDECNTNPDAIPCPMVVDEFANIPLDCPGTLMCFTIGMSCTPVTPVPTEAPTLTPTSAAPTTYSPTSSPIEAADVANSYFCGSDLEDANALCSVWCRYGEDSECPEGQKCFLDTSCNATELNFTIGWDESLLSEVPSIAPTTYKPTQDQNPSNFYCFASWTDASYDGDCGVPCPGGQNSECPDGQFCYGPLPLCNPMYKAGVSTKWCGLSFEDMSSKCATECPNGTDEECPDGEICWGDSPCALKQSALQDLEALEGKLWCGKNYKDLVENCPKQCPGGSDDECGNDMICFDMSTEKVSCNETGVGIKDPVDPLHLWCGSSWNNVLEDCPKACPEGTDEECGVGMICYDLTGNDVICRTSGIGVKEKGDPNKRWCGSDYNDMMSSCPRRCPGGSDDECPLGMSCFEGSDCVTEGVGLITAEERDPTRMFCGSDYTDAMSCGAPCSSGSNDDCPDGQTCWADVECLWGAENAEIIDDDGTKTSSTMFSDVEITVEDEPEHESFSDESEPESFLDEPEPQTISNEQTQTSSSKSSSFSEFSTTVEDQTKEPALESSTELDVEEFDYPTQQGDSSESVTRPEAQAEPESSPPEISETASSEWSMFSEVDMPTEEVEPDFDYPTESNEKDGEPEHEPEPEPEPQYEPQSEPQPESQPEQPQPQPQPESQSEPQPVPQPQMDPSPETGLQVENIRIALYGIRQLNSDHVTAWETLTEEYFERFYNEFSNPGDATRASVKDVDTFYQVTELSLSSARRALRSQRKLSDIQAYLIEYTQTTRYHSDLDIKLQVVLQHPFSNSRKRDAYVEFLKNSDELFKNLSYVSAVFLPQKFEMKSAVQPFPSSSSGNPSVTSSSGNPFSEPSSSSSSSGGAGPPTASNDKFSSFYCHNSGKACPSGGGCDANDLCIFVPNSDPVPVGSYVSPESGSDPNAATSIIGSVLGGEATPSQDQPLLGNIGPSSSISSPGISSNSSPSEPSNTSSGDFSNSNPSSSSTSNSSSSGTSSDGSYESSINAPPTPGSLSIYSSPDSSSSSSLNSSMGSSAVSSPTPSSSIDTLTYSNAVHGPVNVKGEMILTGMEMIKVDNIFEWQYLTAIYEQEFYNGGDSNGDYVKENVHNFATHIEIIQVHYGTDSSNPITVIKFKQTIKYDTADTDIPVSAIVSQPFLTPEYRENYINYLKQMLPDSFGSLGTSSSIPDNVPEVSSGLPTAYTDLSETFFCGESWPVDCQTAQRCTSGDMCAYGQTCFTAPMCVDGQKDLPQTTYEPNTSPYQPNISHFSAPVSIAKPTGKPTTPSTDKEIYPENTYFCGTSIEDAARTCGNPCPTRDSNDCPGEQQCFGNTKCEERESFFCGTSWFEASDKCNTPCPDGDASVCSDGEACFAWTACRNTESYYCGVSFQDASENCAHPCESRSSLDCPEGMGCFAYTTCQATNESAEHVVNPSSIPMNGYFCGTTIEDAATKCATGGAIACQSGNDSQCPGEMKCFQTAECSDRSTYFCGATWMKAAETCSKPCSSGSSDDCDEGESCFAHTGCQASNLFFCGMNFEDASKTCGMPCESRSSDDCPGEQLCFAYVSECADSNKESDAENFSFGAFGDFSSYSPEDEAEKEPAWVASYWAGIESSSPAKPASIAAAVIATFSLWLCFTL